MTTVQSSELAVGPSRIRVQQKGDAGPTILFLHGAGGVPAWTPFFDALAQGARLVVPDHPGFGKSDGGERLKDVPDYAMFYLDLLDQLDLRDVHVVGHSLGGWIAAEIAVRNSTRLKSVSLVAAAGIRVKGSPMGDAFIWGPEEGVRNLYHDQKFADAMLARQPDAEQVDVLLKNRFAFAKLAWEPRGFNPALEKWLHRIKLPTTVVWGREDKVLPVALAARWGELIAGAKVSVLDGCGHLPQVEKPDELAQIVKQHIEGARA
jgi:pimeloyl-ACP methyl ester carboxylesterase